MPEKSMLLGILQQRSASTLLKKTLAPEIVSQQVPIFPFLALVGQQEMKLALLLAVINPAVGGTVASHVKPSPTASR